MFKKFSYANAEEFQADVKGLGFDLPFSADLSALTKPIEIYGRQVANRMIVQPMEGCDGNADGTPSDLVLRRYERFARGGCGLLWVEACAVTQNVRANPRQVWLHEGSVDAFAKMVESIRQDAQKANGIQPYLVLQLTHSGRYSKPGDGPAIIAAENPYLDPYLPKVYPTHVITDEELEQLEDQYVRTAKLAKQAGFDAVDVKACHRYLNSELLSAFTRPGNYGGSFENRTRFLLNTVGKVKQGAGIDVTLRMNAYDEIPYPYGWGASQEDVHIPDLTEPKRLMGLLYEKGIRLIDLTGGNPYYNPHVNRPYDACYYTPPVHQLDGVVKMLTAAKELKASVPKDMVVISTGYSWMREFGANVAAGCIEQGWFDMAGFGRQAFAYPDFASDVKDGGMERKKCCIACGKCSEIMRNGSTAGCVIRDSAVYAPIYKASLENAKPFDGSRIAEHV